VNKAQRKNKLKRVKVYNLLKRGHGVHTGLREPQTFIVLDGAPDEVKAKVQRHLERTGQIKPSRAPGRMTLRELFPDMVIEDYQEETVEQMRAEYELRHAELSPSELAAKAAAIVLPTDETMVFGVRPNKRSKVHAVKGDGTVALCGKDVGEWDPTDTAYAMPWTSFSEAERCKHCHGKRP
jgi:hypothetical protein